jgi:ferredoxin-NADP reductase
MINGQLSPRFLTSIAGTCVVLQFANQSEADIILKFRIDRLAANYPGRFKVGCSQRWSCLLAHRVGIRACSKTLGGLTQIFAVELPRL